MWQNLVKIALLGTENTQFDAVLTEKFTEMGIAANQEQPIVLANASAMVGQMKRAGFILKAYQGELPTPSASANAAAASLKTSHHLQLILGGIHKAILPEFLEKLANAGKMIPPATLPSLMQLPEAAHFWHQIEPLLGENGRWLLRLHPDWAKKLQDPTQFSWQTGSRQERRDFLTYWRQSTPAFALKQVSTTWETESLADKIAFLPILEIGLSLEDEPFLESCLDDKRQEVRKLAAGLLAKTGGSKFEQRMQELASDLVDFNGKNLKINDLKSLPQSAIRDGLIKKDEHTGMVYLTQIMLKMPASFWEKIFGKPPADILQMMKQAGLLLPVNNALAACLREHKSPSWAADLVAFWYENDDLTDWAIQEGDDVFSQVEAAAFNRLALRFLKEAYTLPTEQSIVFRLMKQNQSVWEDELSLLVINKFRQEITKDYRQFWQLQHLKQYLEMLGLRCNPQLYDQLQSGWSNDSVQWQMWEKTVEDMLNRVLFRREMTNELSI